MSTEEYLLLSFFAFIWQFGLLSLIREILLSLLAADYNPSKRQVIYKSQPIFQRLSLLFLKDYINTNRRLFTPYYVFYSAEVIFSTLFTLGLIILPRIIGYNYLLFGIEIAIGIPCSIFLRTKYTHGFRSGPKYNYTKKRQ